MKNLDIFIHFKNKYFCFKTSKKFLKALLFLEDVNMDPFCAKDGFSLEPLFMAAELKLIYTFIPFGCV